MRLNGGIIGVSNEPSTRASQGMFSFAERALNVLYDRFQIYANTFTLLDLFNAQPRPTYNSVSVSGQDTQPTGVFLKPDGTKMYMIGTSADNVRQYTLSVPYNVSTATYDTVTFLISQDTAPQGLFFKPDGTKMYVIGSTNDRVFQYTLSTPWVVSSATYDNISLLVTAQDTSPVDLYFDSSGTILLIAGDTNDRVYKYTLSTAWDVSTATYANNFLSTVTQTNNPSGLFANPSGTIIYVSGAAQNIVYAYNLSTAWDLSTAFYSGEFLNSDQMVTPSGLYISNDGANLYWTDPTNDAIRQYFLPEAWNINQEVGVVGAFSISAQDNTSQGIQFSTDGTKAYIVGATTDSVYQYSLATPWTISTASYASKSFSVGGQDLTAGDLFFKPDGTKMYVVGQTNDAIYQYSLATAWDISTTSYDSVSFSLAATGINPSGLFFKPDGTKFYTVSTQNVYQYALSTPWVVSSASFEKTYIFGLSTNPTENSATGIAFSPNGSAMFVLGNANDFVYQFSLATPWDIATASPVGYVKYYVYSRETTPTGLAFSQDGANFYIVGTVSDTIVQYSVYP